MTLITIPKKLAQKGDLALVQQQEYEVLLRRRIFKEFTPYRPPKSAP